MNIQQQLTYNLGLRVFNHFNFAKEELQALTIKQWEIIQKEELAKLGKSSKVYRRVMKLNLR